MLLLKKKKYAAVKVLFKDGTPYEVYSLSYSFALPNILEEHSSEINILRRLLNAKVLTLFVVTGAY